MNFNFHPGPCSDNVPSWRPACATPSPGRASLLPPDLDAQGTQQTGQCSKDCCVLGQENQTSILCIMTHLAILASSRPQAHSPKQLHDRGSAPGTHPQPQDAPSLRADRYTVVILGGIHVSILHNGPCGTRVLSQTRKPRFSGTECLA